MRKLRIIGIAITAIAALSAIASSIASAEFPRFLPSNGGTFPVRFTGFSGPGTLAVRGGSTIECEKNRESGEILNDTNLLVTIDFEGCAVFTIVKGHSLGDPAGTILTTVRGLLCKIKEGEAGLELTPTGKVHLEAAGVLALVEGSVIGVLTPPSGLTLEFALLLKQSSAGVQEQQECNGVRGIHLVTLENGELKESSEVTHAVIGLLGTTGEIMT